MAYIGVPPVSGDFVVLDAITASATASYTLQRGSVNFSPESANHMLVSLNGSIQKPNSSFTLNGSTITFSSTLASSDSIDFILVLGNVNAVGVATTVADSAITDAKTNFVSTSSGAGLQIKGDGTTDGTLQLNCSQNSHGIKLKSPAHSSSSSYTLTFPTTDPSADKFLKTDGSGNLSFANAGGISEADIWKLTASAGVSTGNYLLTANWARQTVRGAGYIGTGMSQSSGVFSFPSTGYYLVQFQQTWEAGSGVTTDNLTSSISYSNDNFTSTGIASAMYGSITQTGDYQSITINYIFDITDISNQKLKFGGYSSAGTNYVYGATSSINTGVTFIRLGDT